MSARDYYKELYRTGGLDQYSEKYACFNDDATTNFFTFAESSDYQHFFEEGGTSSLPKRIRASLKKNWIVRTQYRNGVVTGERLFFDADETGSYIADVAVASNRFKLRFSFNRQTMRYIYAVQSLARGEQEASGPGKCELIPAGIPQHGATQ